MASKSRRSKTVQAPERTEWIFKGFQWYASRMVRREFESLAVDESCLNGETFKPDTPVLVYANHPSWWDPILAVLVNQYAFPERHFFAPIDARALEKYQVFKKLGFFGIELKSHSGAAEFLDVSRSILNRPNSALWLTPEGQFSDARDHGRPLMNGLTHLFVATPGMIAIPLAIEYVFLNERKPYMLTKLGTPIVSQEEGRHNKEACGSRLAKELRTTQANLAELAKERSLDPFKMIVSSHKRPESLYDWSRVFKSLVSRKPIELRHDA